MEKNRGYFFYFSILVIVLAIFRVGLYFVYGSFVYGDVAWVNDFLGIAVAVGYIIGILGVWDETKFGYRFIAIMGVVEIIPSWHVFTPVTFISGVVFMALGVLGLVLFPKRK
jgi:hypothetical protein